MFWPTNGKQMCFEEEKHEHGLPLSWRIKQTLPGASNTVWSLAGLDGFRAKLEKENKEQRQRHRTTSRVQYQKTHLGLML